MLCKKATLHIYKVHVYEVCPEHMYECVTRSIAENALVLISRPPTKDPNLGSFRDGKRAQPFSILEILPTQVGSR